MCDIFLLHLSRGLDINEAPCPHGWTMRSFCQECRLDDVRAQAEREDDKCEGGEPCWRNPETGYMEYCPKHEGIIADKAMESPNWKPKSGVLTDAEAYDEALREWGRRDEQNPDSIQPPVEVQ